MANIKSLRLPKTPDWPQQELHDMQFYVSRSDIISCTESTATQNIFKLEQPYIIKEIGWACIDAWEDSGSTPLSVIIQVGDTTTTNKYCTLTMAELGSTVRSGSVDVWEESTGTSVDFITVTIDHGATTSDAAEGAGDMYLWVAWSPRAEKMGWANRSQTYST